MGRLKKNPDFEDYLVEVFNTEGLAEQGLFYRRDEARKFAKAKASMDDDVFVRTFRLKFTLVADSKPKKKTKGRKK